MAAAPLKFRDRTCGSGWCHNVTSTMSLDGHAFCFSRGKETQSGFLCFSPPISIGVLPNACPGWLGSLHSGILTAIFSCRLSVHGNALSSPEYINVEGELPKEGMLGPPMCIAQRIHRHCILGVLPWVLRNAESVHLKLRQDFRGIRRPSARIPDS